MIFKEAKQRFSAAKEAAISTTKAWASASIGKSNSSRRKSMRSKRIKSTETKILTELLGPTNLPMLLRQKFSTAERTWLLANTSLHNWCLLIRQTLCLKTRKLPSLRVYWTLSRAWRKTTHVRKTAQALRMCSFSLRVLKRVKLEFKSSTRDQGHLRGARV